MTALRQIYKCNICGNIVEVLHVGKDQLVCCGQPMELLQEKDPTVPLAYLMGSDSLRDLPKWQDPQRFLDSCAALGVMVREGVELDLEALFAEFRGLDSKIHWLPTVGRAISAREIRRRVAAGEPVHNFLTPEIAAYIRRHQLYRPA